MMTCRWKKNIGDEISGVLGRERMGTAFPHKKLSGKFDVPTRELIKLIKCNDYDTVSFYWFSQHIIWKCAPIYVFLSDYVSQFFSNFPKTPFSNYSRGQLCMDAAEIFVCGDKPKKIIYIRSEKAPGHMEKMVP